jgi:chromosome segregation ATPase
MFTRSAATGGGQARNQMPEVQAGLKTAQEDVNELKSSVDRRLGSLKTDVGTVSGVLRNHVAKFDEHLTDLENSFTAFDRRIEPIATTTTQSRERLEHLRSQVDAIKRITDPLNGRLNTIDEELRKVKSLLAPTDGRFNNIDGGLTRLTERSIALSGDVTTANHKIDVLDGKVDPLNQRLNGLERQIGLISKSLAVEISNPVRARFDAADDTVNQHFDAANQTVNHRCDAIDQRLESLTQSMNIDRQLAPLHQRFERLERESHNVNIRLEELRDESRRRYAQLMKP